MTASNNSSWGIGIWGKLGLLLLVILGTCMFIGIKRPTTELFTGSEEKVYILAAKDYFKDYKNKQAIAEFTKAIDINPNNAVSRSGRAESLARIGKYERALEDITAAIILDSTLIQNYRIKGQILHGLQEYTESIAVLSHYIEHNPTDPKGYFERAYSYHKGTYRTGSEYNRKAIEDFHKAIELNPIRAYPHTGATIKNRELASAKSSAYFGLGLAYCRKQDFESALTAFEQSEEFHPGSENALKYIERVRAKLEERNS